MATPDHNRSRPRRISAAEFGELTGRKSPHAARPGARWRAHGAASDAPFRLTLPFLPPSVNKLFTTVRDPQSGVIKRVLTSQARRIRRLVMAMIDRELNPGGIYELQIDIYMPCYTRKGAVRKVDVSNRVKFIEDCVCTALGIDDSQVFRVVLTKHDATDERTELEIRPLRQAGRDAA